MGHLITRQLFELKTGSSRNAFRLQHELSGLFWRAVAPELERIFDRLAPPDTLVRIDKLEIDLGQLSEEDLLAGKFLPHLSRLLEEAASKAIREQGPGIQRLSAAEGHFEQWLGFLKSGFLPWEGRRPEPGWQEGVKETLARSSLAVEQLSRLAERNRQALQRLALQHPPEFLAALAELFTGHKQDVLPGASREWQMLPELSSALADAFSVKDYPRREFLFWMEVMQAVILRRQKITGERLVEKAMKAMVEPQRWAAFAEALQERAREFPRLAVAFERLAAAQKPLSRKGEKEPDGMPKAEKPGTEPETPASQKKEGPGATEKPPVAPERQTPEEADPFRPEVERTGPEPEEKAWTEEQEEAFPAEPLPEGTDIFIPNAGIILAHSFLPRFFGVLELLEGREFKSEADRHKAIHLLHFLATGEDTMPEYELALPKFLCGMPLNLPITYRPQLSGEDKEECEGLLEAVISNWGALGNVSIASLREGFLQRPGKLSKRDTGWLLQVEQQTLDILLDKLPWGIGIVKLPWMEEMLRVEWR